MVVVEVGCKVMTSATLRTRSRATGVELIHSMMHDIRVEDGRIKELRPFYWNVPDYVQAHGADRL